jgi:hypothetical protein
MRRPHGVLLVAAVASWLAASAAVAQQPGKHAATTATARPKSQFVRLTRTAEKRPLALETAIVRCTPADRRRSELAVDLVAAVHVGEKSYYAQLNREFAGYDVVLYELIAPETASIPKGGSNSNNPVSTLQNGMKDFLGMEHQLQHIDYGRRNMVHADMSPEQFSQSMDKRGESFVGMFMRAMGYQMARQGQDSNEASEVDLIVVLFAKDKTLALKRLMAEQVEGMQGAINALDGPQGSTLISQRNKVALDGLRKQIAAGKHKIAIFYGAAHMSDMQKRLEADFGLLPVSTRWLVAWDLKGDQSEKNGKSGKSRNNKKAGGNKTGTQTKAAP